ncbi:uncharacterized protein LOC110706189 [Chenopodium quinoa]|uniref:uncharacterized protein LOC110705932 n=1 Tax=Chenopodium quinoa TaxID=63459 RepID=UPI000B7718AA|nr:uncharacterized protein LOC110705932 [Chenopodium quinoa]XP_021739779.1 uncharacterized protein LOC110706189 [Chenopodium quinoa]
MGKRKSRVLTKNDDNDTKSPTSEIYEDGVVTYYCDVNTGVMFRKDAKASKKRLEPCLKKSKSRGRQLSGKRSKMGSCKFDDNLETIWRSFSEDKRAAFAHLYSFYYLIYKSRRIRALELIKKKHIFSKKYVFVPIVCWDHWRLVIFCHFGEAISSKTRTRCILLLDSAETSADVIGPVVRKLVFDIFKAEGRPESKDDIYQIPLKMPKVPQQTNDFDCGRFVLFFIKLFMDAAPENFSLSNGYPYFLTSNWFRPEHFDKFCNKLEEDIPTPEQGVEQVPRRISQRITAQQTFQKDSQTSYPPNKDVVLVID